MHYGLNPQTEVPGDQARARWYLFMPRTVGDTGKAMWRASLDEEEYVRVEGKWMYKSKESAPFFQTTFEEGWAKKQFVQVGGTIRRCRNLPELARFPRQGPG